MIWLSSPGDTAPALPAAWLVAGPERPANLTQRSRLRRETARLILARQFGAPPESIAIDHDARGRPLPVIPGRAGLCLSLATRCGTVAVALATRPVGIDVERIDALAPPPLDILHPQERAALLGLNAAARPLAFARIWAAKEAYVKALGVGFARAPDSFAAHLVSPDRFAIDDPLRGGGVTGWTRLIENGGQENLAAAIVILD